MKKKKLPAITENEIPSVETYEADIFFPTLLRRGLQMEPAALPLLAASARLRALRLRWRRRFLRLLFGGSGDGRRSELRISCLHTYSGIRKKNDRVLRMVDFHGGKGGRRMWGRENPRVLMFLVNTTKRKKIKPQKWGTWKWWAEKGFRSQLVQRRERSGGVKTGRLDGRRFYCVWACSNVSKQSLSYANCRKKGFTHSTQAFTYFKQVLGLSS